MSELGRTSRAWWLLLQPDRKSGRRGDPGSLARLRRAGTIVDAALEPATLSLARQIEPVTQVSREVMLTRVALIAGVLAAVREDVDAPVATACGRAREGGENAAVGHLHMQRLMAAKTLDECLILFRRLVHRLGDAARVSDLTESLWDWTDEYRGDRRRIRWSYEYYGAGAAAPTEAA